MIYNKTIVNLISHQTKTNIITWYMKNKTLILFASVVLISIWSCKKEEQPSNSGFPDNIVVDIPDAISSTNQTKALKSSNSCLPIPADSIYYNVRNFIGIGEISAQYVQKIITALKQYDLTRPMQISFTSNEDNKIKNVVVTENQMYGDKTYDLKLVMKDSTSGNMAMQIYWNKENPEGIAIVSPSCFNTTDAALKLNSKLMYQVEYSSVKTTTYDKRMVVSITGNTLSTTDIYSIDNLKMEVLKQGDIITIKGTSNHPNAVLVNVNNKGYSYAFVAKGDMTNNIGAINLALPPNTDASANVFSSYSVEAVVNNEITEYAKIQEPVNYAMYLTLMSGCITSILNECKSPAYYNSAGYVSCGATKPSDSYNTISELSNLLPYAPDEVRTMAVTFAQ